jgi:NAD(P)-dependent dehydrogenase (short-subunit alcohol dehydrogenase family)
LLAVNCLGPYLFTKSLHPVLESTAKSLPAGSVRVIWLGSLMIPLMAPKGGMDFDNLDYKKKWPDEKVRYAVSKTGNLFIGSEWAKRDADNGIVHLVSERVLRP